MSHIKKLSDIVLSPYRLHNLLQFFFFDIRKGLARCLTLAPARCIVQISILGHRLFQPKSKYSAQRDFRERLGVRWILLGGFS